MGAAQPASLANCLALSVLAACGGGSGDSNPSQPAPVPPGGTAPVAITQANGEDAAVVGVAMLEAPVQLALAGLNPFIGMLDAGLLQRDVVCGSAGSIELATVDNDSSGAVSAGDVGTVSYVGDCFSGPLNAPAEGDIELLIGDLTLQYPGYLVLHAEVSFPGNLTVSDIATTVVSGGFEIAALVRGVTLELLTIDVAAPGQLSIAVDSGSSQVTERLTQLSLRRRVPARETHDRPLSVSATSRVQSEFLDGTLQCRTDGDLATANALEWPTAGIFECTGASGSAVHLDSNDRVGPSSPVSLLVDPEGDGTFGQVSGGPFFWGDFVEGELFTERVATLNSSLAMRPLLTPETAALPLNDLVYAPKRSRLFGSTDTSIVEIDPATLVITRSVDVPGRPGAVAISEDETALWIGLDDSNELQRIALATMTAGPAFPLGVSVQPSGLPRTAFRIGVAPGATDLVVLTTTDREMLAYNNGVQLAGTVDGTTIATLPPSFFVFRNASDIVAATASSSSTVYRVTLDPLTGLTVDRTISALIGTTAAPLKLGIQNIYTSRGNIFNDIAESVEGELRPDRCCYRDLAVDPQSGQIHAMGDIVGGILDLYTEDNLVRIGEYSLPDTALGDRLEKALLTGDYLFFTRGGVLERYQRGDIVPNLPAEPCTRVDLSGLIVDGTYLALDCALSDVVFDESRNLLYAGLDDYTALGNSIAVIDPDSLGIIPVGAPPGMLKLSPDNSTLFTNLVDTSKVGEIDLDAHVVRRIAVLGAGQTGPYMANALAPTAGPDGDVVVSMNRDLALFDDGAAVGNVAQFVDSYTDVFVSEDGSSAFGQTFHGSLDIFNVSSSGVAFMQEATDVVSAFAADQEGQFIYSTDGRRFDMITRSGDTLCIPSLPANNFDIRVGHDPTSELVYFGAIANLSVLNTERYSFAACDPDTAAMGLETEALVFVLDEGRVQTVLPLPNDKIAIHTDTHLVLLDRSP